MVRCLRAVRGGAGGVMMVFVRGGSESNGLDDIERVAWCDVVGRQVIPCAQLLDSHAKPIGDGNERVVAAHGVTLAGSEAAAGRDGDNEFIAGLDGLGNVIEGSDLGGVGVQRLGNLIEGFTALHNVEAPAGAIRFRNIFKAGEEHVARAGRKMQTVGDVAGRGQPQKGGVERDDLRDGCVGEIGYEAHVDGVVGGDFIGENGGIGNDVGEAVLFGILRHDGCGDDAGNVIFRFARKSVSAVELPVVGIAGLGDGVLDAARTPVVGSHGEIPVAELVIERLHVAGVGEGGELRVEALIEEAVALEAVGSAEGHELPHAAGA